MSASEATAHATWSSLSFKLDLASDDAVRRSKHLAGITERAVQAVSESCAPPASPHIESR